MLDLGLTSAALYSKKEINRAIAVYKRKINLIMSFKYNMAIAPAEAAFDRIFALMEKIERLQILKNVMLVAVGRLTEIQKNIILLFYFKGKRSEEVKRILEISEIQFKYNKKTALDSISFYMYMLGLTNERFLEYFNEESAIIRNYELYEKLNFIAENFKNIDEGKIYEEGYRQCNAEEGIGI